MSLPGIIVIVGLILAFGFLVISWLIFRKEDKHGHND